MQYSMKRFTTIKQQAYALLYLFIPCMECCGYAEIVYTLQSIEKRRITMW